MDENNFPITDFYLSNFLIKEKDYIVKWGRHSAMNKPDRLPLCDPREWVRQIPKVWGKCQAKVHEYIIFAYRQKLFKYYLLIGKKY